jgi:hypothetical protein
MRSLLFILIPVCLISADALAAKCTINEDMVFVIDGKKVFPIGFTMPPPLSLQKIKAERRCRR